MPLRVLIVDDNADHADSLATLVGLWGHVPTVRYDGESGWQAAQAAPPDCLVLDINMPRIDGYTLAGLIRCEPQFARTKLIAVTARTHPDHKRRLQEAGFDYDLTKPAPLDQLEGILKMIENIARLAEKTEELSRKNAEAAERTQELARRNVELAGETKELIQEVKNGLHEVKQEVREIKGEVREIKEEVREVADQLGKGENAPPDASADGPKSPPAGSSGG